MNWSISFASLWINDVKLIAVSHISPRDNPAPKVQHLCNHNARTCGRAALAREPWPALRGVEGAAVGARPLGVPGAHLPFWRGADVQVQESGARAGSRDPSL